MTTSSEIWGVDTEWGFRGGRLDHESVWEPVVLCLVGLCSGRRLHFWGRDPRLPTFFAHGDDLFVAHYAIAELKYLFRLGVTPPARWFDTYIAWRLRTNRPGTLEGKLTHALHRLGLPHLAPAVKADLQQKILNLRFDAGHSADRQEIVDYCFMDCDGALALYEAVCDGVPVERMAIWAEYLRAIARMELRGIPFDVDGWARIQQAWPVLYQSLVDKINETWPIFASETFRKAQLLNWCRRTSIAWPTRISEATGQPYHPFDRDTMRLMGGAIHTLRAFARC